jgi:hypothetical protein
MRRAGGDSGVCDTKAGSDDDASVATRRCGGTYGQSAWYGPSLIVLLLVVMRMCCRRLVGG